MSGPTAYSNSVDGLTWNVPIADQRGNPTPEFQTKWAQQAKTNGTIPDLTTAAAVSGVLDVISATPGSLLARGPAVWSGLAPSAAGKILKDNGAGVAPSWATLSSVVDLIGNVQGNVLYRNAAGWVALAPGTAGQVFTTGGAGANPAWATPSSGGGAASAQDDGTNLYLALSDTDGQLVLDGIGDPIFATDVLPPAALPLATTAAFGAVKPDGVTIAAIAGVLSAIGLPAATIFFARLTANQATTTATYAAVLFNSVVYDTLGAYNAVNGNYTPLKAGKYLVFGAVTGNSSGSQGETDVVIVKNGTWPSGTNLGQSATGAFAATISNTALAVGIADMNGTTDFLRITGYVTGAGSCFFTGGVCYFGAVYLGP